MSRQIVIKNIHYIMNMANNEDEFLKRLIKNKVELDHTLKKNQPDIDLTPTRNRVIGRNNFKEKENVAINNVNINHQTRSPRLGKKKSTIKVCANHSDREAEFKIIIDGERFDYCSKCGAHLASQGFQVEKIGFGKQDEGQNPRKTELNHFLKSLRNLQSNYHQKLEVLSNINQSYDNQKSHALGFYHSMMEYLEATKEQHLKIIQRESMKHIQICEIQCGQINQTLQEIQTMREDVQNNLTSILGEVEEDKYRECLSFYLQKMGVYEHRLDELGVEAREAPVLCANDIESRLQDFKSYIQELTGLSSNQLLQDEQN